MNLRLERRLYRADGIFSELKDESLDTIAYTLEHSYNNLPKLPNGIYTCTRYMSPKHGYVVFLVNDVPGHDHIEFHIGNYNRDSIGCILVGRSIAFVDGKKMLTRSKDAFTDFMRMQDGLDTFQLVVAG